MEIEPINTGQPIEAVLGSIWRFAAYPDGRPEV